MSGEFVFSQMALPPELVEDLRRQNPWWEGRALPVLPPHRRHLVRQIHRRRPSSSSNSKCPSQLKLPEAYVRAHGIDHLRQEGLVVEFVSAHGKITRSQVIQLLDVSVPQAKALLDRMAKAGKLRMAGSPPRWAYYVIANQ